MDIADWIIFGLIVVGGYYCAFQLFQLGGKVVASIYGITLTALLLIAIYLA